MKTGKEIWDLIKNKPLNVFAFDESVDKYFQFIDIDPTKCYLMMKATAALPALETALGNGYLCTMQDKYILVEAKNAV